MEDKLEYTSPTIQISEFSIQDIIRVSIVPCPSGHEPCDPDITNLDEQILNGEIK